MNPREKLQEICDLLEAAGERYSGMRSAVEGNDEELCRYLTSNKLWGGAGSVADQAALAFAEVRSSLEKRMIELGVSVALGLGQCKGIGICGRCLAPGGDSASLGFIGFEKRTVGFDWRYRQRRGHGLRMKTTGLTGSDSACAADIGLDKNHGLTRTSLASLNDIGFEPF